NIQTNLASEACDGLKTVDGRLPRKNTLCARPVLGNLTNKVDRDLHWVASQSHAENLAIGYPTKTTLTATAVIPSFAPIDGRIKTLKKTRLNSNYHAISISNSRLYAYCQSNVPSNSAAESGYGGSDTENQPPNTSTLSSNLSLTQNHLPCPTLQGPECKRPRCDPRETTTASRDDKKPVKLDTVDESEIDRRPFKSKLACDIIRAAFADRVQLEELLAECRRADFAISALDRSPIDRMMEATDYIVGIMAYEQIRETKEYFRVGDFLSAGKQPNLTADMLTTLADWLVEVQEIFAFNHETIHLAWGLLYAYFDRGQPLARREIQLMACAAIMVACKHEESKMPQLTEFLYITDGAYKREEFIDAERRLLIAIDFAVHRPNPYVFLRRYARVLDAHSGLVQYMSRFLLETGMHSHAISLKRESRKAAAVLWLARVVLRNPSYAQWTRRTDVRQLRQFIRSNRAAQVYYEKCINNDLTKQTTEFRQLPLICPDSGALDLTTTTTVSASSLPSRTVSLTNTGSQLAVNMSDWIESRKHHETTLWIDRTISEPSVEKCHLLPLVSSECVSAPAEFQPYWNDTDTIEMELESSVKSDLEAMKSEESQRSPFWPPILEHITGYKETDLIPLAVRYHAIAMRLIAEVARGGRLSSETASMGAKTISDHDSNTIVDSSICVDDEESEVADSSNQIQQRCASPGGHYLRRQAVTKYCSDDFLNVAFENFVPHFPSIQCTDTCACFVCVNLVRRIV
ncbi:hypothetical protein EG68_11191, partial [Paragonimus skrjabini miyazakii]